MVYYYDILLWGGVMKCVLCGMGADQKHHVCYEPEMIIDVCLHCHKLVHRHGVGRARKDVSDEQIDGEIQTENNLASPYSTYEEEIDGKQTVFLKHLNSDSELLYLMRCPSGCEINKWDFFYSKKTGHYIIRCRLCGFDALFRRSK